MPPEPTPPDPEVASLAALTEDPLAVGGRLYLRLDARLVEQTDLEDQALTSPNTLDVYLDARPNERLRAFAQGRVVYVPTTTATLPTGDDGSGEVEINVPTTITTLDQLWVKWDVARVAFLTVGRQPLKWGAGRIWSPGDFVNAIHRNPLEPYDLRSGITAVRAHVPIESLGWSFQLLALLDGADTLGEVGAAGRAELVLGTAELGLSAGARRDRPLHLGADLSAGLGPFDLIGDVAVAHGNARPSWSGVYDPARGTTPTPRDRDEDWIVEASVGIEYALKYADEDTVYIGLEYFHNDAGYADADIYPWLLAHGAFQSLYVGRHYAGAMVLLPEPGGLEDTTFVISQLVNLSDRSTMTYAQMSATVSTSLSIVPYAGFHAGRRGGELRMPIRVASTDEPDDEVPAPTELWPAPVAELGVWLSLAL